MAFEERLGGDNAGSLDSIARASMQRLVDNAIWIPMRGPEILFGLTNVVGWGGDLCYIPDMEEVMKDTPSLIDRIFAPGEISYSMIQPRPGANLAARYAAKEAGFKAFGFAYRDLTIVHETDGHPTITLEGEAKEKARKFSVRPHLVTLSHDGDYALAFLAIVQIDISPRQWYSRFNL